MLGTIVNTVVVLVGSLIGLFLKGGISKRFEDSIMKALDLNMLEMTRIKVANFLPAIFVPMIYYILQSFI